MVSTSDFRNGLTVEFRNDLYVIVSFQHVKPGKGPAFVRTKLKSLTTGRTLENTFSSGEKLKDVRIERHPYQFLYQDDMGFHFMHRETYEQTSIPDEILENKDLMKEGQEVDIIFHSEKNVPLSCELPPFVELKVTYTEPGFKGDTSSSTTKPATLETNAEIKVPLFVNIDDIIKIDTRTREYSERVK